MSHENAALIVIDAQESFRHMPYWSEDGVGTYMAKQQALVDGARAAGIPVVQIFHNRANSPFDPENGFVRTLEGLTVEPDAVFHKREHSALAGTGLETWLRRNNIGKLIISGIRTEQCCETTTRHASDIGFSVDYVTEATLTFAMTHASGAVFSADDIKMRTELVLAGRFATIVTVDHVLAAWARREAA